MNPVFTAVIIGLIVITSGAVISTNILSSVAQTGNYYSYANAKNSMISLQDIIKDISLDINGSRHFTYSDTGGYFVADSSEGIIRFSTDKSSFSESLTKKENNVFIRSGPPASVYLLDVDNDMEDEFVLENEAVLFAVNQIGSPDSFEAITDVIALITNKQTNTTVVPVLNIDVNGADVFDTGYTEMLNHPISVSSTIHLHTESVDVYFSLSGGNDFIEIRVEE